MPLLYTLLALLLWLVATPFLVLLSSKKKYRQSIPQRYFPLFNPKLPTYEYWFHACSLGEVRALQPFITQLGKERCVITTITQTGFTAAKQISDTTRFLPFEFFLFFWIRPVSLATLVVMEAELWYLLFFIAKRRRHRVVLLNARISERGFKKYRRMRWLYRKIFAQCDQVLAQSEADAERLRQLGATAVETVGNIKLLHHARVTNVYEKPSTQLVVAASTHEAEEALIARAFMTYRQHNPAKLVVVPRHPERFDAVYALLENMFEMKVTRFSTDGMNGLKTSDVMLMDAMGELINMYNIADIAIIGGSFVPVGGHNPLEAAEFGCKIISGEHIFFQKELYAAVSSVQIVTNDALLNAMQKANLMPPSKIIGTIEKEKIMNCLKGSD